MRACGIALDRQPAATSSHEQDDEKLREPSAAGCARGARGGVREPSARTHQLATQSMAVTPRNSQRAASHTRTHTRRAARRIIKFAPNVCNYDCRRISLSCLRLRSILRGKFIMLNCVCARALMHSSLRSVVTARDDISRNSSQFLRLRSDIMRLQ